MPPEWLHGDHVLLREGVARQIARVLRMSPGDHVVLLDNSGAERLTELGPFHSDTIEGSIISTCQGQGEPHLQVTLCQGLLKGSKLDWALQKGVELGGAAFIPLLSRRSVPRPKTGEEQLARWRRIISEAAEQSGRSVLPKVYPAMPLSEAFQQVSHTTALMPYEEERERSLHEALQDIPDQQPLALFIGPEGGWDPEEVALARSHDVVTVSLGQRVLRAETAAIAALSAVMYSRGELGRRQPG